TTASFGRVAAKPAASAARRSASAVGLTGAAAKATRPGTVAARTRIEARAANRGVEERVTELLSERGGRASLRALPHPPHEGSGVGGGVGGGEGNGVARCAGTASPEGLGDGDGVARKVMSAGSGRETSTWPARVASGWSSTRICTRFTAGKFVVIELTTA